MGCRGDGGGLATSGYASGGRGEELRERSARGNPPGLITRGFLPCGKREEAGCVPRVGGLPKGVNSWPRKTGTGQIWPRENTGIPQGIWAAKVGLRVKSEFTGQVCRERDGG